MQHHSLEPIRPEGVDTSTWRANLAFRGIGRALKTEEIEAIRSQMKGPDVEVLGHNIDPTTDTVEVATVITGTKEDAIRAGVDTLYEGVTASGYRDRVDFVGMSINLAHLVEARPGLLFGPSSTADDAATDHYHQLTMFADELENFRIT